jgi:hypothetical protein
MVERRLISDWHGTEDEALALVDAVKRSCDCQKDMAGRILRPCGAHRALIDQRFLDGLLWGRHAASRYRAEEWSR